MIRRDLLRRVSRLEALRGRGGIVVETFTDPVTGELWERHVAINRHGDAMGCVEVPAMAPTAEAWCAFVERTGLTADRNDPPNDGHALS